MDIDSLMLSLIIILFPILVNVLHDLYVSSIDKEKNNLFLDIALISSLYLFTALDVSNVSVIVVVNTIFLLSLIKRRIFTSVIITIFIIFNYHCNGIFNVFIVLLQHSIIYALYAALYKQKESLFIKLFVVVKIVFIFIFHVDKDYDNILLNGALLSVVFILVVYLVVYLVNISEDIVKLHMDLKELEKEKKFRESMFKITHEIKNPIAVCKSYLDMFDFNNPDHQRYIPILKEEMNNILFLLQDFTNMSKIKIESDILDINLLLEEITRQLSPLLLDDNIEFNVNISDEEFYIEGDYNRLRQVLTNVIKNAKEARDKNKKSYINVDTEIVENNFIIKVEDNGVGMDEEAMKRVEEPFYTTKKNGTGLGVPLSSEIIKSHNGTIEYISEKGVGTKVIITLPFGEVKF